MALDIFIAICTNFRPKLQMFNNERYLSDALLEIPILSTLRSCLYILVAICLFAVLYGRLILFSRVVALLLVI